MYDENTQAIVLLTSYFSKPVKGEAKPLTVNEYAHFAHWLNDSGYQPSSLFHQFEEVIQAWRDPKGKVTADRIKLLLDRGVAMGLALEKWERAGIWIITRQSSEYPKVLKKKLGHLSPPFFYGVGNKSLLTKGGIAVIGSRGVDESDENFTKDIAVKASNEGLNIVSGAARGVDETAMLGALDGDGTAIGVMADGLLKAALFQPRNDVG